MIGRIWHGWTTPHNADNYEGLLKEEIFPAIAEKKVPGYNGIQLFRRPLEGEEVEFVAIMWFDSWDAVKQFAGRIMSKRICLRRRGRCWRGSTSAPNTTRSRKVLNTKELTQLGVFPKGVIFGPRPGSSENSVKLDFSHSGCIANRIG